MPSKTQSSRPSAKRRRPPASGRAPAPARGETNGHAPGRARAAATTQGAPPKARSAAAVRLRTQGRAPAKATSPAEAHAKPLTSNRFLPLLQTVKREVDTRLLGLLDAKVDDAETLGRDVAHLVAALRDLCTRGGKRLRAGLVVAGFRAADAGAPLEPALDAAVAVELLQAYFLIHDDWIDDDDVRRGGPSVHAMLAERLGSQKRGNASAILAGDYASALALEVLSRVESKAARTDRLLAAFSQMQTDAILGQQLDLSGNGGDTELAYKLKTGSYTVSGPLRLGALLGGAPPDALQALERYAIPTGIAFQLRDDLLDLFGNPRKTGRPRGSDLRAGKQTPLLAAALDRLGPRQRKPIVAVLGKRKASELAVQKAISAIAESGAPEAMEARITALAREALSALEAAQITPEGDELLRGAVSSLTERRG